MDFPHKHLLSIESLRPEHIQMILERANLHAERGRSREKHTDSLKGLTQINLFFENSTRTQASFEIAGLRLGLDVMSLPVSSSSVIKGETIIDTAVTLNAMNPDILVVRHGGAGAVNLLAEKMNCSVINAGDGRHEHPTQGLLDALTILRRKGQISGLTIAICGDIAHSRVARSNIQLLQKMGNRVRLVGPVTLVPSAFSAFGVEIANDMKSGLEGADVVMMLRLQKERMQGSFVPSEREYFHMYGLDEEKLSYAKPDALVMHPGPMNRGIEIDGAIADDLNRSAIPEQVEMGVAVRMAVIELLLEATR